MRTLCLAFLASSLLLLLTACGGGTTSGAPGSTADSGTISPAPDSATRAGDSSSPAGDSGAPGSDTGATTGDSGTAADTGSPGLPDAGPPYDAGPFVPGMPITAPASTWTWVPFPDAYCANGEATGLGVNLGAPGSRVLIYLEGGGACWSDLTCYVLGTAVNISTGYGPTEFMGDVAAYLEQPGGFFDRTTTANPFQEYSYVYLPYCTGDVFAGNAVTNIGGPSGATNFVGYRNMHAFLERLVPTFSTADRVYIAGSSAGGFGAAINWGQTQQAFGTTRVDLIDDSGTFMPADILAMVGGGYLSMAEPVWDVSSILPPGCPTCLTDNSAIYKYYSAALPNSKGALLSYVADSTLPTYFGISTAQFTAGLTEVQADLDSTTNLKYFFEAGPGHVLWSTPTLATNGVTLQTFLTQMTTDDPSWASVHP